jgi:ATP-binding cassette subfamily B protein RaxB
MQSEDAECGLACIAMVLANYGHHVDMVTLRHRYAISLKGSTLRGVMDLATALGLTCRALRLDLDNLHNLKLPAVVHWDLTHFVVLVRVKRNRMGLVRSAIIHDPALGRRELSLKEFSKHFTGVAVEMTPSVSFERKTEKPRIKLATLMGRTIGLKRSLFQIFLLATALEVFSLVSPLFMQWVVDYAILSADHGLLNILAVSFALLLVVQTAIKSVRSWVVLYMSTHLGMQWVANVFAHLLALPITFFEKRHLGDIISRFGSVTSIQRTITTNFVEAIVDGLLAVATLVMILLYSVKLSVVVAISILAYGLLRFLAYKPFRNAAEDQLILQAKEQTIFIESIRAIQSIKLFNQETERRSRWLNALANAINRGIATSKMSVGFSGAHDLTAGACNLLLVWFGARLVMDNEFSVGMLFAFMSYAGTFSTRVYSLIDRGIDLKMLSLQAERLSDIVLTEKERDVDEPAPLSEASAAGNAARSVISDSGSHVPVADAGLECVDLSFRYGEGDPLILENLNLSIASGESVAIIGPSGCGKTTLVKLLLGLLDATNGAVLVGGIPIRQVGIRAYREMVGTVMQEDQLLTGSISENISFFDATPDHEWIEECARTAMIHETILAMPMGYHSLLGDMGSTISGGQKQRILLARALYKRPRILILDEATSHLDVEAEIWISQAIGKLALTRVIVAHRPETMRSAERIIDLSRIRFGTAPVDAAIPHGVPHSTN